MSATEYTRGHLYWQQSLKNVGIKWLPTTKLRWPLSDLEVGSFLADLLSDWSVDVTTGSAQERGFARTAQWNEEYLTKLAQSLVADRQNTCRYVWAEIYLYRAGTQTCTHRHMHMCKLTHTHTHTHTHIYFYRRTICLQLCQHAWPLVCLPICMVAPCVFVRLSASLSTRLYILPSVRLPVCLSVIRLIQFINDDHRPTYSNHPPLR